MMLKSVQLRREDLRVLVSCNVSYPLLDFYSLCLWIVIPKGFNKDHDSLVVTNDPKQPVQKAIQVQFHLLGDLQKHNYSLLIKDIKKKVTQAYTSSGYMEIIL